jgi:integrase
MRAHKTWKSNGEVVIPLHPWAYEILKKYDFYHPHPITNQKANLYIKEIFEIAGFTHLVTHTFTRGGKPCEETRPYCDWVSTHTRRRYFASTWIRAPYKVDPLIVRMVGGWKSEKQFLKYVKLTPEEWAQVLMDKLAESGVFLRAA